MDTPSTPFPPNPYVIGVPLTADTGFYGRSDVFQFIGDTLDSGQQRVIVLFGQRRVGKTSILHQAMRQLQDSDNLLPVYFDLQGKGRLSIGQVLLQIARELARTLNMAAPPETAADEGGRFFAEQVLPAAYECLGPRRRLLLLFDEFDVLGDDINQQAAGGETAPAAACETLFPYLQNLILQQERIAFIFVVGRRIDELPSHFSAVFKQAAYRRIGLLREADARELILQPSRGVVEFQPEAVAHILRLGAGHPYFTQLLCSEAYNYLRAENRRELSGDDLLELVDHALETGHGALNWFWEGLPAAERFILSAIASVSDDNGVAGKTAVQQVLEKHRIVLTGLELADAPERLVEWEILQRQGSDAYHFTVDLVRRWMQQAHPLEAARRDVNFISKRAARLYDLARDAHMAGELEDARDDYQKALAANPNHSGAQLGLAQVLYEVGDLDAALTAFERAYAIDEASARDGLVRVLMALAEHSEAIGGGEKTLDLYEKLLKLAPQNHDLRDKLVALYEESGDELTETSELDKAIKVYERALYWQPKNEGIVAKLDAFKTKQKIAETFASGLEAHRNNLWEIAESHWVQLIKLDVLRLQEYEIAELLLLARQHQPIAASKGSYTHIEQSSESRDHAKQRHPMPKIKEELLEILDIPTFLRRPIPKAKEESLETTDIPAFLRCSIPKIEEESLEDIDIPAFLRRT